MPSIKEGHPVDPQELDGRWCPGRYTFSQLEGGRSTQVAVQQSDCNPIENLWAYFQDAVAKEDPKTTEQFRTLLDDAWWKIDQGVIRNLYHSMHSRLRHVIAAKGKMTKY